MKRILSLLCFLVILNVPVYAQSTANSADYEYVELVERAQSMPDDFDFGRLREVYAQSKFYKPYDLDRKAVFRDFKKRINRGDPDVFRDIDILVAQNFALPLVHMDAVKLYKDVNAEQTKFHDWAAQGLLDAAFKGNHGRNAEYAPNVLTIEEEYIIVKKYGEIMSQRIEKKYKRPFDVITVNPDNEPPFELWFDVSWIFNATQK